MLAIAVTLSTSHNFPALSCYHLFYPEMVAYFANIFGRGSILPPVSIHGMFPRGCFPHVTSHRTPGNQRTTVISFPAQLVG